MPIKTHLTRSTRWNSRALSGLAVVSVVAMLSACQAAPAPVPTPQCVRPTLTLGSTQFPIETLARATDGSFALPADEPGTAFWIEGTNVNYVFALNSAPSTLALKDTLKSGDEAKIAWADCTTDEYVVKSIETSLPANSALFDQTKGGITVFVQGGPSTVSLVVKGARPQIQAPETPSPTEANAVQAEISFLGNTPSPDGKSVQITLTLTNTGSTPISLTTNDISLTPANAASLAPLSVESSLPQTIQATAGATFSIMFPHPGVKTAVFKILDFSVDLYF